MAHKMIKNDSALAALAKLNDNETLNVQIGEETISYANDDAVYKIQQRMEDLSGSSLKHKHLQRLSLSADLMYPHNTLSMMAKHLNELITSNSPIPESEYTTALAHTYYQLRSNNLEVSVNGSSEEDIITHGLMRALLHIGKEQRQETGCQCRLGCPCAAGSQCSQPSNAKLCYYKLMGYDVNQIITILPYHSPCPFVIELPNDKDSLQQQHHCVKTLFDSFQLRNEMAQCNFAQMLLPPALHLTPVPARNRSGNNRISYRSERCHEPLFPTDYKLLVPTRTELQYVPEEIENQRDTKALLNIEHLRDLVERHDQIYLSDISFTKDSNVQSVIKEAVASFLPAEVIDGGLLRHSAPKARALGVQTPVHYVYYSNKPGVGVHVNQHNETWNMSSFHLSFTAPPECYVEKLYEYSVEDSFKYQVVAQFGDSSSRPFQLYCWEEVATSDMLSAISDCVALYVLDCEGVPAAHRWRMDVILDFFSFVSSVSTPLIILPAKNDPYSAQPNLKAEHISKSKKNNLRRKFNFIHESLLDFIPGELLILSLSKAEYNSVYIGESKQCGGLGLFAKRDFAKGDVITSIRCIKYSKNEWMELSNDERKHMFSYVFGMIDNTDAYYYMHFPINHVRFLNSATSTKAGAVSLELKQNVGLTCDNEPKAIHALHHIKANDELFYNYEYELHDKYDPADVSWNNILFDDPQELSQPSFSQTSPPKKKKK